jgi:hypothetical protein
MPERGPQVASSPLTMRPRRKRLGVMLVDQGIITEDQLAEVRAR